MRRCCRPRGHAQGLEIDLPRGVTLTDHYGEVRTMIVCSGGAESLQITVAEVVLPQTCEDPTPVDLMRLRTFQATPQINRQCSVVTIDCAPIQNRLRRNGGLCRLPWGNGWTVTRVSLERGCDAYC